MKLITVTLFILSTCFSSLTWADEMGNDSKDFEALLQSPYEISLIFNREQSFWLPKNIYQNLNSIALQQAQIWADTILEGDYHAAGQTQLDQVEGLYKNGLLVGYRIIYSEQAWDLNQCEYYQVPEENREKALQACPQGRIFEASFVSLAFTTFIRDDNQFAEFKVSE